MAASSFVSVRRRGDWILYLLMLAAVMCLPLVIEASKWVPEGGFLLWVAFWGSLLGVVLARRAIPGWLAWLVAVILGIEVSIQMAGKVLPSWALFTSDVGQAAQWLWTLVRYQELGPLIPFARSAGVVLKQAQLMVSNLTTWYLAIQSGSSSLDNTALWLAVSLVVWLLAWNAGFELFRRRRTFAALLPLGVAVVFNVSFTYLGLGWVTFYLATTLLTLVWANAGRMEEIWARLGLDFSSELRRDAVLAGVAISAAIWVLAVTLPYFTISSAVWFFWDNYGPRFTSFYKQVDRAFAGRNPVPTSTPSPNRGLPQHNVAGGGLPGQETVFIVRTTDPSPLPEEDFAQFGIPAEQVFPKRYWRDRTYDVYTGHGWDTSTNLSEVVSANRSWRLPEYPHVEVSQTFTLARGADYAFAVGEPVTVTSDYRVMTRGDGDLAALSVGKNKLSYSVISWVPDVTEEELRVAEGEYPEWVKKRFLPLPRIPERIRQTAQEVVTKAEAKTRYDKAHAVQLYLRQFVYDLNLEPPALDADVVDYFLFTAKRGYCDYTATAMVVMLRSLGVAARYASGYGQGTFSPDDGVWIVTGENAHAWAEVYFPEYGWVEFEPTPVQNLFYRPSTRAEVFTLAELEATRQGSRSLLPPWWAWVGGLVLVLAFVIIWPPRWFRRERNPRQAVWQVYQSLTRRARWLGLAPYGGQTPREYLRGLATEVERRLNSTEATKDIELIQGSYESARYGDAEITLDDRYRAEGAWRRLRGRLNGLLFRRAPRPGQSEPKA
jgi:hypothetical protein